MQVLPNVEAHINIHLVKYDTFTSLKLKASLLNRMHHLHLLVQYPAR
jgi:hypothetical protein